MRKPSSVVMGMAAGAFLWLLVGWAGNGFAALPFTAFSASLEIETEDAELEFELEATFTLDAASDGINPSSEEVTLKIGNYSVTIPAGSFKQDKRSRKGHFEFEGTSGGAELDLEIRALEGGGFRLEAEGEGANLSGAVSPVEVTLTIGNDSGSIRVNVDDDDDDDDDD